MGSVWATRRLHADPSIHWRHGALMAERRFLGEARLKNEGDPTAFDPESKLGNYVPRGAGQSMRGDDLASVWLVEGLVWYVVRDKSCSYDIDDEEAPVWTLSRVPGEPGWETDSGFGGYGLKYSDARELADAANRLPKSSFRPSE